MGALKIAEMDLRSFVKKILVRTSLLIATHNLNLLGDTILPPDSLGLLRLYRLYIEESPDPSPSISSKNPLQSDFWGFSWSGSDSSVSVWGVKRFGIAVGKSVEFRQSMELRLSGQIGDSTEVSGHIVDSDLAANSVIAQEPSEFDRIYIKAQSPRFTVQLGDIAPFGIDPAVRVQGVFSKFRISRPIIGSLSVAYGNSRSIVHTMGFRGRNGYQGPYQLRGKFGEAVQVIPGSEHVFVNGKEMKRGRDKDYLIDYEAATLNFTPKRVIHDGDTIIVRFAYRQFEFDKVLRGMELSSGGLSVRLLDRWDDVSHLNEKERRKFRQLGDTAGMVNGGIYVGSGNGDYRLVDGHFEFVGEGNGDYVVNFEYVGDGNGDYRYDPNSMNFVFVGTGNGDFIAARRAEPPEWQRVVEFEARKSWLDARFKGMLTDRNILASGALRRGAEGSLKIQKGDINLDVGRAAVVFAFGGHEGLDSLDGLTVFQPKRWFDGSFRVSGKRWTLGVKAHSERRDGQFWMENARFEISRTFSEEVLINNYFLKEQAATHRFGVWGVAVFWNGRLSNASAKLETSWGDSTLKKLSFSFSAKHLSSNLIYKDCPDGSELLADFSAAASFFNSDLSFSGNILRSYEGNRSSFLATWTSRFGLWGSALLINSIEKRRLVRYRLVGEEYGDYSYDPMTGRYYPDEGGSYVREVVFVPSGEQVRQKKLDIGITRTVFENFDISLTADFEDGGDRNSNRITSNTTWKMAENSSLQLKFDRFFETNNPEFRIERMDAELQLEKRHRTLGFGLTSSSTASYMTSYRHEKFIFGGVKGEFGRILFRLKRLDAYSPPLYDKIRLNVVSFEPKISMKFRNLSVSMRGEAHYGISESAQDEIQVQKLKRILPVGLGYRYVLIVKRDMGKKSTLKVKLSGDQFKTRLKADIELRF